MIGGYKKEFNKRLIINPLNIQVKNELNKLDENIITSNVLKDGYNNNEFKEILIEIIH